MTDTKPRIGVVFRGIGDSYGADVYYPNETAVFVKFVRTSGSIVMVHPNFDEPITVDNPERFGAFGAEWVRNFFA